MLISNVAYSQCSISGTSNSPLCAGQSSQLQLSVNPISGADYVWVGPSGFSSHVRTPVISPVTTSIAGRYTVTVTGDCGTSQAFVDVVVSQPITSVQIASNAPVCSNQTLSLSASEHLGAQYVWNGPQGFTDAGRIVNLNNISTGQAGSYGVSVLLPGCTPVSASRNVQVLTTPVASPGSNTPVCQGNPIYFNALFNPGSSYAWTGPNAFSSNAQNPSLAGNTSNSGIYTLIVSHPFCGADTAVTSVDVGGSLIGLTTFNNSPVCEGNTLYLSASPVFGATYAWTGPLGFNSAQNSDSIQNTTLTNSGIYLLSVSSPGCGSITRSVSVDIQSLNLSLSSNSPLCEGNPIYFSAPLIPNASYAWQGPSGYTSTVRNASRDTAHASHIGIYSLTITTSNCSILLYDTIEVGSRLIGANTATNAPICQGSSLNLSVTDRSGFTYFWSGPDGFTSDVPTPTIPNAQLTNSGIYTVVISSPGCGSNSLAQFAQVISAPELVAPNWIVGTNGDFATLQEAIASAQVLNGQVIQVLPGTYNLTSTLQINKQLTIIGDSDNPSSVVFQTTNDANAPTSMIQVSVNNVRLLGMTFRHRKTTNISVETAVSVSGPGWPQTRVSGFVMGHCRIEHVEFGVSIRGTNWMIKDTEIAYTEFGQPANSTRRHIGVYGLSGTCFIDGVVFEDQTLAGNSRAITPTSTTGNNPNETYIGNLIVKNCSQVGRLQQFYSQDAFQGDPDAYHLWFVDNAVTEYSLFVGFWGASANFGGILGHINVSGNAFTNAHPVEGKGMIAADGMAPGTFRTSPLLLHHTSNVPTQTAYRAGFSSVATIAQPWVVGRNDAIPAFSVTDDAVLMAQPTQPSLPVLFSITNNGPLCEGSILRLSASSIPGASFAWTGPNGFTSAEQYPVLSNVQTGMAGIYTVSLTTSCGVSTGTTTVIVGADISNVIASSNAPLCEGTSLNLTTSNHSSYSILWSGPNSFSSALANPSIPNVTNAEAGIYTLYIESPGCGSLSRTFNVSVTLLPVLSAQSNSPACQDAPIYFSSNFIGDATYAWQGPNAFTSNIQNPSIDNALPAMAGVYTVIANSSCGADTLTLSLQVSNSLTGINLISNAPVCEGSDLRLSATIVSGTDYSWQGPSGFTSNIPEPVIPNAQTSNSGLYSLTVSASGCVSRTITREADVFASPTLSVGSNSPLCQSRVLYFNASSNRGATYAWSGPNGFVSALQNPAIVNVQPLNAGIYTLVVNTLSCGSQTLTTSVSIGASLVGANILVNNPVCAGQNIAFTAPSNSTWNYAWTGPAGFNSSISNPTVVNAAVINSGIYTVEISSPGCGSRTLTRAITVNDLAVINPGSNSPICQGNVLYLTTNGVTGATYLWNGPNGFVSTAMNPGVGNMQQARAGEYSLTVNTPGCGTITATTQVLVTPSLSGVRILSNSPVCQNSSLQLSATQRLHYSYSWTGPNGFTSTLAEPVIPNATSANQGTYTVVFTAPGCGTANRSRSVSVVNTSSVAALNSGPACVGNAVYFTGRGPVGSTYSWSGPVAFGTNRQNPSRSNVQLSHAGEYTLNVNVPGCGIVSTTTTLVVNPCREADAPDNSIDFGDAEAAEDSRDLHLNAQHAANNVFHLQLSPNPATGNQVTLHWSGLESKEELSFVIYDITGKALDMRKVSESDRFASEAHYIYALPENFAKGVYLIKSQQGEAMHYLRFIIE